MQIAGRPGKEEPFSEANAEWPEPPLQYLVGISSHGRFTSPGRGLRVKSEELSKSQECVLGPGGEARNNINPCAPHRGELELLHIAPASSSLHELCGPAITPRASRIFDKVKVLLTYFSSNAGVQYRGIVSWTPSLFTPRGPHQLLSNLIPSATSAFSHLENSCSRLGKLSCDARFIFTIVKLLSVHS
jgi:hypothetical protein